MSYPFKQYLEAIRGGDTRSLARCISLVENEVAGYESFLELLDITADTGITGVTGPPGAGKSTIVDAIIEKLVNRGKTVAVLCIDPSSPFNLGAILGDRVRMSGWYNHPGVFIRSLATRGSLGGLHPRIIEITEVLKAAKFDHIIVETVGVGQSEIEITGLADTTVVVLVPEAGDDIQGMKAGLMEIADIFVVNKADRPEADIFIANLRQMMRRSPSEKDEYPAIIKTIASKKEGIDELVTAISNHQAQKSLPAKRSWLLTERAFHLVQQHKMKGYEKERIKADIDRALAQGDFNLFKFVRMLLEPARH